MELKEVTGDAVAKMLREMKETGNMRNPYRVWESEVKRRLGVLERSFEEFKASLLLLWQVPSVFTGQVLAVADLSVLSPETASISFTDCKSK